MKKCFALISAVVFLCFFRLPTALAEADDSCSCVCDDTTPKENQQQGPFSTAIELSELYPAPNADEEEFIELKNNGSSAVDLSGWKVADASNKTYTINSDGLTTTTVDAGEYFVIPQSVSKIYLNNDQDSIILSQPNDTRLDETTYEDSQNGSSWNFKNNQWQWSTTVTSGKANVITQNEDNNSPDQKDSDTTTTEEETAPDKTKYETSDGVFLSELLPDPTGLDSTDEWIEIENTTAKKVYLGGWQLTDQSKYYTIGDVSLAASERLVFEVSETGLSLNNSGDTVYLIDPFGKIINGTTYENSTEGYAWARFDDAWQWPNTPTPGEANVLGELEEEVSNEEDSGGGNSENEDTEDVDVVSVELFRTLEDGQSAQIEGVVTVLPNTFGSQYFYVQDDSAGIQVYSYSKAFPDMQIGDRVRINGEKSTARNESRIKTKTTEDIVVLNSGEEVVPRDTTQLEESLEGMLIQTEGIVTESSSNAITINDSMAVVLKDSTGVNKDLFEEGKSVTLLGIEGQYDEEYRLMPRTDEDVAQVETDPAAIVPEANAQNSFSSNPDKVVQNTSLVKQLKNKTILLIAIIVGLLVITGGLIIRLKPELLEKIGLKLGKKTNLATGSDNTHDLKEVSTIFDIARKNSTKSEKK